MNEELNQKIHEWLGKCWHENVRRVWIESIQFDPLKCPKCDIVVDLNENGDYNPDYTTDPAAILELIEAVRARGFLFRIENVEFPEKSEWEVLIAKNNHGRRERADTLPMAVARACGPPSITLSTSRLIPPAVTHCRTRPRPRTA